MFTLISTVSNNFSQAARVRVLFFALSLFVCLTAATQNASAANYVVTRTDDRNATCVQGATPDCSLREALNIINTSPVTEDRVNFNIPAANCNATSGVCTITLTSDIVISKPTSGYLIITGTGADRLTISGGGTNRLFFIDGSDVTIESMTLTGGNGTGTRIPYNGKGGAIYSLSGNVTLNSVIVNGNTASVFGGGVAVDTRFQAPPSFTVNNSTFSGNSAGNSGGGFSSIVVTISNSTVSGNTAGTSGGGVQCSTAFMRNVTVANNSANYSGGGLDCGGATMRGVTISANSAGSFGGGFHSISNTDNNIDIGNTIIAGNTGGTEPDISARDLSVTSAGYNLIGNPGTLDRRAFVPGNPNPNKDIVGTAAAPINPQLDALKNNGGATKTMALLLNSPAIDKGNSNVALTLPADQRGRGRYDNPLIPNASGGNGADIGAFELTLVTFVVTKTADTNNAVCATGDCSLREAVVAANASAEYKQIDFSIPASDAGCNSSTNICTITLTTGSEIAFANTGLLTINGTGANRLTINGGAGQNRIFYSSGATVFIKNVTLTGGNGFGAGINGTGGAIYYSGGTLNLDGVQVTGNTTTTGTGQINSTGGVYLSGGTHQFVNSTVSGNTSDGACAGFQINSGSLNITNSTVSGNIAAAGNGGGGCVSSGTLTLRSVTITNNSVSSSFGGAGIFNGQGTLNLGNTIIAGNTGTNFDPDIYPPTFGGTSTVTTAGFNLVGNNSGVETVFPAGQPNANNDRVGTSTTPLNPRLAPLGNYGGATLTHALLNTSPAINNGNPAIAGTPVTDQRGAAREGNTDIGAFERNSSFVSPLPNTSINRFYSQTIAQNNVQNGTTYTYSVTSGSLPPGLSLTTSFSRANTAERKNEPELMLAPTAAVVAITGTPTSTGTYPFTVTAVGGGESVATNYSITVLAPTAASVSISGRVNTPQELGLTKALVTLTDMHGDSRIVLTGKFGSFRFMNVTAGETYILTVTSKRYTYAPQVITVTEDMKEVNFMPE